MSLYKGLLFLFIWLFAWPNLAEASSISVISNETTKTETLTRTLWLKADVGVSNTSGNITSWVDQTGNGYNASPNTGVPTYITAPSPLDKFNYHPSVHLNQTTFTIPVDVRPSAISDMEVFMVVRGEDTTKNTLFGNATSASYYRHLASHQIITLGGDIDLVSIGANKTTKELLNVYYGAMNTTTSGSSHAQVNNGNVKTFTEGTGTGGSNFLNIGTTGQAGSFVGNILEMILYDGEVSSTTRNVLSSYLAIKYGMHLRNNDTNDYVDSDGTVVWDASANVGFNNDIVGIGRDDATSLNQKIAAQNSTDYFNLIVSLDNNFTALNNASARTTTHTNNKQYLMLGDNAGLINFTNPVHIDGYKSVSWLYWKVQKQNFTQNVVLKLINGQVGTHLVKSTSSNFSSNVTDLGEFSSQILTNVSLSDGDYLAIAKVGTDPGIGGFGDETKTYGDPDFTLTAPTSNGTGAFTYFSADTSIASVVSTTGVVSINAVGAVVLTAQQASDGTYNMATVTKTLTVLKKGISASGITALDKIYDGTTSATLDVSGLSFSGIVGSDVVTVTSVGVFDTKNVGTNKTVTLTNTYGGADIGNYNITDQTTTTASITAKTLTITTSDGTKVFDGTPFSTFSVTYTGFVSGEDASILSGTLTYTGTALTQFDVGTYSAIASGYSATNYSIQYVAGSFSITKAGLSISGIKANDKVYDGTTSATVDLSGISYTGLASGDSITVTSTAVFDNKNVGTGKTVTLTNTYGGDATNYTITDQTTTTASITAKTLSVTASSVSKTYDGAIYSGGYSVTYDGFVSGDDASLLSGTVTYTGSAIAATSVGSYTISPSGYTATNYSIANVSGTLTISKAGLTVSKITAEDKVYDGTTSATVNTSSISYTGLISGDSITVTSTAVFDTKNVGTGKTVTLTNTYGGDATNYTITDQTTTTASITAKTLTITAIDKSKTYDGAIYSGGYSVTYTGFVSGENASVLAGTVTYTGAALTATDVGTYSVTPDGYISANYTLLFESGTLSITKAGLTVSGIKANDKVYDGTTSATVNLSGISYLGLASGDSITVNSTGVFDTKNVGTGKTITLTNTYGGDATNYTITDQTTTTASITTKELVVTAVNVTRVYDGSKYSGFTVNYNSFASGESVSDLSGTLSFTGAGVDAVAIGSYSFTAQGLSSSNYNISYVGGSHIIKDPAEIPPGSTIYIIPTASQSKTYGATNPTLTYSTSPTVTLTGTLSRVSGENIGTYSITLGTVTSSVYTLVLNPEVFTIHKKTITTTGIKAADKVYDTTTSATVTTSSVVFVGLVGSDVVTVTSSGVFDNKNVGVGKTVALTNTYGGADLSKYTVVDQTSTTATITAATMTVTNITAYDKVYDGTKTARLNSSSMSYTGLLAGDTVGITPVGTFVNKHVGTNKIINLSYTFSVTANYQISYQATSTASITPATLSVTTVDATKTYDGSVYSGFTVSFNGFQGTDSVVDLPGTLSFTGSGTTATEVGVYSVTATGYTSNNYNINFIAGTLTINAAPEVTTVRVIPSASQSKTYGETDPVFTYTTEPDTELEGTLSRVAGEVAGTYQFTLGSLSHSSYSLAIDAVDFIINPRTIIVSGLKAKDKIYDGTTSALVDTSSVVFSGLLPGDTASVVSSGVFEDETIGTDKTVYLTNTFTLSAASSYLIVDQTSCTASITSIPIYVIPDADQFKVYGSSYPIFSYTTSPTTVLTGVLGREIGSNVGTYSYTLGTLESPSHSELILVNDFFTILKKDLEITANDDYFRYDYSNQPYWGGNGIQVKGFVYGETLLHLKGIIEYSGFSQGAFEVGIYDIVPGGLQSNNYEITYKKGLLTIDDPDTDGDGLIDSIDEDDDGDGQLDVHELTCGSDPLDFLSLSPDRDGDQLPDCLDTIDDKFAISGVITPRSSGMEATWKIVNLEFYPNHHIRVFNQNKKLVFETTHYQNDWSGTYLNNSKSLPANAYYFIVNLNNGEEPYTGWVYITY